MVAKTPERRQPPSAAPETVPRRPRPRRPMRPDLGERDRRRRSLPSRAASAGSSSRAATRSPAARPREALRKPTERRGRARTPHERTVALDRSSTSTTSSVNDSVAAPRRRRGAGRGRRARPASRPLGRHRLPGRRRRVRGDHCRRRASRMPSTSRDRDRAHRRGAPLGQGEHAADVSAGVAELRAPTTSGNALFERADERALPRQEAGKARTIAAGMSGLAPASRRACRRPRSASRPGRARPRPARRSRCSSAAS